MTEGPSETPAAAGEGTTITAYPDGPLVVRGPAVLVDEDGEPVERRRRTVALCRCGHTTIAPFCDGTHKVARRRRLRPVTQDGGVTSTSSTSSTPDQEEDEWPPHARS